MTDNVLAFNANSGEWKKAIPAPYYHNIFSWLWLRMTGYRDQYGRKAELWQPWQL